MEPHTPRPWRPSLLLDLRTHLELGSQGSHAGWHESHLHHVRQHGSAGHQRCGLGPHVRIRDVSASFLSPSCLTDPLCLSPTAGFTTRTVPIQEALCSLVEPGGLSSATPPSLWQRGEDNSSRMGWEGTEPGWCFLNCVNETINSRIFPPPLQRGAPPQPGGPSISCEHTQLGVSITDRMNETVPQLSTTS